MEEFPEVSVQSLSALSFDEEAAMHQRSLDAAGNRAVAKLAVAISFGMTRRLYREMDMQPNEPILFWGQGYFENPADQSLQFNDNTSSYYYGESEGIYILPVPQRDNSECLDLKLVHSVSVIANNNITERHGHSAAVTAHIPVSSRNFRPLYDDLAAFASAETPEDNRSEQVICVAQDFSNCRNQVFIKNRIDSVPAASKAGDKINELEALVGPRGCGLIVDSPYAYTVNFDRSGVMQLRPTTCLRGRAQSATFLGIGDFADFDRRLVAIDYRHFNYDLHDGLFMGLALSDPATRRAGLKDQAVLVPLSGNDFNYQHI